MPSWNASKCRQKYWPKQLKTWRDDSVISYCIMGYYGKEKHEMGLER